MKGLREHCRPSAKKFAPQLETQLAVEVVALNCLREPEGQEVQFFIVVLQVKQEELHDPHVLFVG